jgi:predicted ribosomally synthesized peptide with SipW-like signal peptide
MKTAPALRRVGPTKLLMSLAAVTMVGVVGIVGTQAALSDTTDNTGNEFNAGQIDLTDNDAGSFMYDVENVLPEEPIERCIQVNYTTTSGTPAIDSTVELYMGGAAIGPVGPYVDLTIEAGTQGTVSFPGCTGFTPVGAPLYQGTLSGFQATHGAAGAGVAYTPNGTDPWHDGDSVVYRVTLELQDVVRPDGDNFSGTHTYTWRADAV